MIRCKARWRYARRGLILWGIWWGSLGGAATQAAEGGGGGTDWDVKVVVVLTSEDGQSHLENEQIEGMRETIPSNVELRIDYLDAKRMSRRAHYKERYKAIFFGKYRGPRKSAAVVALNDEAIHVLGYYRNTVFKGQPRIVSGSHPRLAADCLSDSNGWTGVFCEPDFKATMDTALALHPHARRAHILTPNTHWGLLWRQKLMAAETAGRYPLELLVPEQTIWEAENALTYLRETGPEELVFFMDYEPIHWKAAYFSNQMYDRLLAATGGAVYTTQEELIGRGAVGGCVVNGRQMGRMLGQLVVRVLSGENARDISPLTLAGEWQFDHLQLQRWGIPKRRLPEGSRIVNQPNSELRKYRGVILGGAGIMALELTIIVQLWRSRRRRQLIMKALQASETRYRQLFEGSRDLFAIVDSQGSVLHSNVAFRQMLGKESEEEAGGESLWDWIQPEDCRQAQALVVEALQRGGGRLETQYLTRGGELIPVEVSFQKCAFGEQPAVLCCAHLQSERQQIQMIAQQIAERERQKIGHDIHDGMGQYIMAMKIQIHLLEQLAVKGRVPDEKLLAKLNDLLAYMGGEVRSLARSLVPFQMANQTLQAAMQQNLTILRRLFRLEISLKFEMDEERISDEAKNQLFRLSQEAARNAARHARAQRIRVWLHGSTEGEGELVVENDGIPFEGKPQERTGLGLSIMTQRARIIGGVLEIQPIEGKGTRVVCRFPLMPAR